jgi:hypothetical protein
MRRVLVLSVLLLCAGCGGSSSHPAITASPRSGLLDAPPRIRVSGVRDGAVVRARTVDDSGQRWASTTRVADLRRDPTRLLWTLRHGQDFFLPPSAGFVVRLGAALPYLPTQSPPRYGGSLAADEAAKAALWPRILDFMRGLGGG